MEIAKMEGTKKVQERFLWKLCRMQYFGMCVGAGTAGSAIGYLLKEYNAPEGVMFFVAYLAAITGIFAVVGRLHDLDLRGWLAVFMFIPFVNIVFGLFLLFTKGVTTSLEK
ncbi:MAG: hypothetical protein Ta2C_10850 [Candidatus Endomicrobiellum trichonymphae]|uniref:DUF805 domain-containing protein n=1 Tax=Endomicrobium trichonymphae TaxID=1408204 RepID=UPI0027D378C4|nr:MAG: hypothetical protein Ta2C_10850 [Candidatus Endomicrobium trichonymphae]